LPLDTSGVSGSRLAYPTSEGVGLGIVSRGRSPVNLDVAFSAGSYGASFTRNQFDYHTWPWIIVSTTLTQQPDSTHFDSIRGYSQAPFVHSDQPVAVYSSETQVSASNGVDVTFEQILSTSQVGTEYVTFPSLPLNSGVKDNFTIGAVYNDTWVKVPLLDTQDGYYDVNLVKAGDTYDLELYASGFHHVTGSKPFYLYARLSGAGGGNPCTVTLLAEHLWTSRYTVQMSTPWAKLQDVYIAAVGETTDMATVGLKPLDGVVYMKLTQCQ
ncbi:hypothetical protein EGW08_005864, partial [Elysia chlorotica]